MASGVMMKRRIVNHQDFLGSIQFPSYEAEKGEKRPEVFGDKTAFVPLSNADSLRELEAAAALQAALAKGLKFDFAKEVPERYREAVAMDPVDLKVKLLETYDQRQAEGWFPPSFSSDDAYAALNAAIDAGVAKWLKRMAPRKESSGPGRP